MLSRGAEEDATFASQGVAQLERAVAPYRVMMACELLAAVRLLRQDPGDQMPPTLSAALELARAMPQAGDDHDLRPDLLAAADVLDTLAETAPAN